MRLFAPFLVLILSSCSTTNIFSIESFEKVELKSSKLSPDKAEINFLKYRVSLGGDIQFGDKIFDIKNLEIFEKDDKNIDFHIEIKAENRSFKNRNILFGKFIIWNGKHNFIEEIIPISDFDSLERFFSTVRGYIIEKRVDRDDEVIFKINIGKNRGLEFGSILNIYGLKKRNGYLSKIEKITSYKIGTAVVSKVFSENWSWIYLQNKKVADKIFKGDKVILKKGDFGEFLEDGTLLIKNNQDILDNSLRL